MHPHDRWAPVYRWFILTCGASLGSKAMDSRGMRRNERRWKIAHLQAARQQLCAGVLPGQRQQQQAAVRVAERAAGDGLAQVSHGPCLHRRTLPASVKATDMFDGTSTSCLDSWWTLAKRNCTNQDDYDKDCSPWHSCCSRRAPGGSLTQTEARLPRGKHGAAPLPAVAGQQGCSPGAGRSWGAPHPAQVPLKGSNA